MAIDPDAYSAVDLKAATPDSSVPSGALIFGADSQSAAAPSVYPLADLANALPFTQSGEGAVARSVQDKLRETVTVDDFGAVGDGVTDDTDAIQAALDSGAAAVVMRNGATYAATGTITIPAGVLLRGQSVGGALPILAIVGPPTDTVNRGAIELAGDDSCLEGVHVTVTGGDYRRGISAGGFARQHIRYNRIEVSTQDVDSAASFFAIHSTHATQHSEGCEIVGNEITATVNRPGDLLQLSRFRNGLVEHNRLTDSTFTGATRFNWAIYLSKDGQGTKIRDNYITGNNLSGINHNNDTGATDYGVEITGNKILGTPFTGIGVTDANSVSVRANRISGANSPISVNGSSTDAIVESNEILDVDVSGGPVQAEQAMIVVASSAARARISGNIFGSAGDAIRGVYSDAPWLVCVNNVALADGPICMIQSKGASSQIAGNNFPETSETGGLPRIYVQGDNSRVAGNVLGQSTNTGEVGIRMAADRGIVTGNRVIGGRYSIWLDSQSSNCLCNGNITTGHVSGAIQDDGTTNTVTADNLVPA